MKLNIVIGLLVILVLLAALSINQDTRQNEANMSFWIHSEDRKLFSALSADLQVKMGIHRTKIENELHPVFQFLGAIYKQKKFGSIDDNDWRSFEGGFSFFVNSDIGKDYWVNHIAKHQSWPKDFIDYGNGLIKEKKSLWLPHPSE